MAQTATTVCEHFSICKNLKIFTEEIVMKNQWFRRALLISVLAGAGLAVACGVNPDGKYQDADGAVTLELKDGKATLNFGGIRIDGTYKVDGSKVVISPAAGDTSQSMAFTINGDGSLAGPAGSQIPKLVKAK
jgi:hypothetical protein